MADKQLQGMWSCSFLSQATQSICHEPSNKRDTAVWTGGAIQGHGGQAHREVSATTCLPRIEYCVAKSSLGWFLMSILCLTKRRTCQKIPGGQNWPAGQSNTNNKNASAAFKFCFCDGNSFPRKSPRESPRNPFPTRSYPSKP